MNYEHTLMRVTSPSERQRAILFYLSKGFTKRRDLDLTPYKYIGSALVNIGGATYALEGFTEIPLPPPNPLLRRRNV